ncbi:MAG: TolC family protein [Planctomicrobium sp.]|jgi:hypothetical protein|nr:TolC family protein [Planctomicrobium sp.]
MLNKMRKWKVLGSSLLGLAVATSSVGCSRSFWRQQADTDTYEAITEHLTDQRWAVPRIDITPDPRSRFYDPYDPDAAPLPPDDPAAHTYMHWVGGWEGYKCWHQFGDLMSVENPQWLANFGMTPEMIDDVTGEYVTQVPEIRDLKLTQAVELAQIHDRDYQFELEDLFLNALDVTFERYQLGIRYLEPTGGVSQTLVEGGDSGRFNVNGIGLSQSLPWGTQLVANLANTTLWTFGAGGQSSSVSTMSFQILQPLLNDAGRKVNLEALTQVERNLLYQARDLARFRKILFSGIVNDYLGLMLQIQAIRNERGNIIRLEEQVGRLLSENDPQNASTNVEVEDLGPNFVIPPELQGKLTYRLRRLIWRGLMNPEEEQLLRNISPDPVFQTNIDELMDDLPNAASGLDVLQLQFDLTNSTNRLRGQERSLQDNLDSFKISLGLPPDMEMSINDFLLLPFQVIDPLLTQEEEEIKKFNSQVYQLNASDQDILNQIASGFHTLLNNIQSNVVDVIASDLGKFKAALPERLATVSDDSARTQLTLDYAQAQSRFQDFRTKFQSLVVASDSISKELNQSGLSQDQRDAVLYELRNLRQELLLLVQGAAVIQVSSRVELIKIADFDIPLSEATQIAMDQRLDLMNAKARVMDSRRRVEVIANDLKAVLDLGVEGSMSTDPGGENPFDFRSDTGRLEASLSFDTPLDQINERNAYREALVNYQRARRTYMAIEDSIKADVRSSWRQLNVLKQNLETSRLAVRIAALQYESAVDEGNAPVDPRQVSNNRASGNQGQNLTRALNSILSAQNQLIQNYVSYERNRLNIYRDMGIMEIGPDGIWNDTVYRSLGNQAEQNQNDQFNNIDDYETTESQPEGVIIQTSAIRESEPLDRRTHDVRHAGGTRLRDQNDDAGVVELRHLLGQFNENPNQPADRQGTAKLVSD